MASLGTITLKGESGKTYEFGIYARDTSFKAVGAVYVMAKLTEQRRYRVLYIGQTGDLSSRPLNHHRTAAFDKHGADHVLVRVFANEKARCDAELDLIHHYDPVCNKQKVPG